MSLPNSFQVYKAPNNSSWSRTSLFHLGKSDSPPLYTCKQVVSWSGKFTIDLHHGSTADGAPIANSTRGSARQPQAIITIPKASDPGDNKSDEEIIEPFRRHASFKRETWDFVVAVDSGNERHAEKFEWRHTHGDEIASLRGGKGTYGWKLVRLQSGGSTGGEIEVDGKVLGESSDGKEVVAVWADDNQTWFRGAEKGVIAKLEFFGSGAASGEGGLGERWKLFVAMSALHMRQVNLQEAQATAATT
jgi:hypothetical protein